MVHGGDAVERQERHEVEVQGREDPGQAAEEWTEVHHERPLVESDARICMYEMTCLMAVMALVSASDLSF